MHLALNHVSHINAELHVKKRQIWLKTKGHTSPQDNLQLAELSVRSHNQKPIVAEYILLRETYDPDWAGQQPAQQKEKYKNAVNFPHN